MARRRCGAARWLLKLLIYAPTGAVAAARDDVAARESLTGRKNWDYRFAWTRDMAYSLEALFRFGLREETHGAISWLLATIRRHGPDPRIFYRLDGAIPGGQVHEYDVPGWRGHGPVRRRATRRSDQLQLGVFGDLFSIVRLYVDNGNVLDAETGRKLAGVADTACDAWQQQGLGHVGAARPTRHYTTSKMGCWKALTDAVALAEIGPDTRQPGTVAHRGASGSAAGSRSTAGHPSATPTSGTRVRTSSTPRWCCMPSAASTAASG